MIGTAFGIGTPTAYPQQPFIGGPSFGQQGFGVNQPGVQPYAQTQTNLPQLLQMVFTQLQQLQQLEYVQQQQLQQLLHTIPAQLSQLQQLIQFLPQHIQQLQQSSPFQQPFGQVSSAAGYGVSTPWGIAPQVLGAQPSHVM